MKLNRVTSCYALLAGFLLTLCQPLLAEDLMEVYDLALQSDPVLRGQRALRNVASENIDVARSQLLPNVAVGASADSVRQDTKRGLVEGVEHYSEKQIALNASQPLYDRSSWYGLDSAESTSEAAQARYRATELDLMTRVANAYFNVLSAQDVLTFRKAELEAIKRQLDQAKQRFEVGVTAITSVYEAQAAFDRARADLVRSQNDLDNANQALEEIVGQQIRLLAHLQPTLKLEGPMPADIEYWAQLAQENSPDVQTALKSSEASKQDVEVARSGHYPSVDLVASYAYSDRDQVFDQRFDRGSIGLQAEMPIYAGGGVSASTRSASFGYQASLEQLDQQRRAVDREVRDAYRALEADMLSVRALKATVASGESSLEATEAGYEVGTRTIIDVLNQQQDLFRSKSDYARARYDYILSKLRLQRASGTLSRNHLEDQNKLLIK
ncbi:MAG: TolC family outer membrane protein [gamma proteobacterium symbiont of Bathyaustriella thionipta]|nr:TolC family outer membrane protein [gamma proteobacterium symbiont of Bathyaustriella thionipta]